MFLSTPAKIFHAILLLPIVFAGCARQPNSETPVVTFASEAKSEIPFPVREPEVFQARIVVRTGEVERSTLVARSGSSRRIDFDIETENHRAVLITDKEYVLSFKRKTVEERPLTSDASAAYEPLAATILNLRDYPSFEEVRREGRVIEYRATINESSDSEVSIFFDGSIGMPVRQEFYSIEGDKRTLRYSVELLNFTTDVDPGVFEVPAGFKSVARRKN